MSIEEFECIMKKIDDYTDYVALHVLGEPLLHRDIESIIDIANKYGKKVNITTNGMLLKDNYEILKRVREVNISLHSIVDDAYIDDIILYGELLSDNIFVEYRLWSRSILEEKILDKLSSKYDITDSKLSSNLYLNMGEEFEWPNKDGYISNNEGTCYGTRSHIAILVDGSIVPCCLDYEGVINFGNIFDNNVEDVINSKRFNDMKSGFINNVKVEELCSKCNFFKKR